MKIITCLIALLFILAVGRPVYGQQQASGDKFVTNEEYQKLKADHEKLEKDFETLKAQMQQLLQRGAPTDDAALKAKVADLEKKAAAKQAETDQSIEEMDKELQKVKTMAKESKPGTTGFLVGGYGTGGFNLEGQGGSKLAYATFNPLFLWKLNDRLLFEGELEAELAGNATDFKLEVAQVSYLLNDYMTLGVGKFLNPINFFVERQHMGWVNKLPDKPLGVYDGFLPEDLVGAQLRGGVPIGPTKIGYSVFVANSPSLKTDVSSVPVEELGTFEFDNFDNIGNRMTVGGRIGFLPIPALEVGYGIQWADVTPSDSPSTVNAIFQSVDLSYIRDTETLKGIVSLRAQWAWSRVGDYTYDLAGIVGGPYNFDNNRDGGYVQLAYRPTKIEQPILMKFEPVIRFDMLNEQGTLSGVDEHRITLGLGLLARPELGYQGGVCIRSSIWTQCRPA